ncbi:hypothetical protein EV715DRAFT_297904 [Schizophyllum commune]
MATRQIFQLNVVTIVPLPPNCAPRTHGSSYVQEAIRKARRAYQYNLQTGAWCFALEQGFGRNTGWTDNKVIEEIQDASAPLEEAFTAAHSRETGDHLLLFSMYLARLHNELRTQVKEDLQDCAKRLAWLEAEGEFQGPVHWFQEYDVNIRYKIGADVGKAREVVHQTASVLNMYIPGSAVSWLVGEGIDPGKSDLYLRLENGHLIGISWWDTIPAPLPGSEEEIHLEVHTRNWPQRPSHLIRPVATPQCVECEFYPIHSAIAITLWLPVLEGGWIIPEHHRELLAQRGFHENAATAIVYSEPRRSKALKWTTLSQPVAVNLTPARPPILVWRALCAHCYRRSPPESYYSLSHFC